MLITLEGGPRDGLDQDVDALDRFVSVGERLRFSCIDPDHADIVCPSDWYMITSRTAPTRSGMPAPVAVFLGQGDVPPGKTLEDGPR